MKKIALITTALALTFAAGAYAQSTINIFVNGKALNAEAKNIDGRVYLPVRAVAEALGLTVGWNQSTQTVSIVKSGSGAVTSTPTPTSTVSPVQDQGGSYNAGNLSFYGLTAKSNDYGSWDITAEVRNDDNKNYQLVNFTATFYDDNGNRVGKASGGVLDLNKGDSKTVDLVTTDNLSGYTKVKFQIDGSY